MSPDLNAPPSYWDEGMFIGVNWYLVLVETAACNLTTKELADHAPEIGGFFRDLRDRCRAAAVQPKPKPARVTSFRVLQGGKHVPATD